MTRDQVIAAINAALLDITQSNTGAACDKLHTLIDRLLQPPPPPAPHLSDPPVPTSDSE